jgi:hypothetical protein
MPCSLQINILGSKGYYISPYLSVTIKGQPITSLHRRFINATITILINKSLWHLFRSVCRTVFCSILTGS